MTKEGWSERPNSQTRYEVKLAPDGKRLLVVAWYSEGTNFWAHDNGIYSHVPTETEIKTLPKVYEAINNYNQCVMFKKNFKSSP